MDKGFIRRLLLLVTVALLALATQCLRASAGASRTSKSSRRIHVATPKAGQSRYAYVPFDVPANARRVTVTYAYDRAGGANTLDLGLFDSRSSGRDTDARGFRGWSGGRRETVFVARDEATPGYLPGPLPAGTWHVILGLYRVAPEGVDVSLTFQIESDVNEQKSIPPASSAPRFVRNLSLSTNPLDDSFGQMRFHAPPERKWFRGDLHAHTIHSDGEWTAAELKRAAHDSGLDFLFVTDHNTPSHHADVALVNGDGGVPLVLRGEEVTTYGGHVNAWGLPEGALVDFRVRPGDRRRMARVVEEIHRLGALASVNHPFALCGGCDWGYGPELSGFDSIEVWNGAWDYTDERALGLWDSLLQKGRRITAVGSSDTHRPSSPPGLPTTRVAAEAFTERGLLEAIRRGRVQVTRDAKGPSLTFIAEAASESVRARNAVGDELTLTRPGAVRLYVLVEGVPDGAGLVLISGGVNLQDFPPPIVVGEKTFEVECADDTYFRVELRDRDGSMLAFTNPIYVSIKHPRNASRRKGVR